MPPLITPTHGHGPPPPPPALLPAAPRVSARLGVTLGAGSSGVGGSYLAAVDVWPSWWGGVGLEGVRAGSTRVGLLVPDDHDTLTAGRLRLSLRALRAHGFELVGTVGLG